MSSITWTSGPTTADGMIDRGFTVERDGDTIPGALWTPAGASGPLPLVLMGHGGGGNKRAENLLARAHGIVRDHGVAVASIDAPGHGDRGGAQIDTQPFWDVWSDGKAMTNRASADWSAVLDALLGTDEFDVDRVGWFGLSMGTMIGLPFVAQEPRIRVAVLGLCGITGRTPSKSTIGAVLDAAAPSVTMPTIWMLQWDDERFDREGALHLFDGVGSTDKRLVAHLGKHAEMPEEGRQTASAFLVERLKA